MQYRRERLSDLSRRFPGFGGTPITGLSYQDSNLAYKTTYSYTVVAAR